MADAGGWRAIARTWGSTAEERRRPYPCDAVLPDWTDALFRAVSVRATPAVVFRWLCQLRVAPYSYDWIDHFGRQSPQQLTPGLEQLAVGQRIMSIFDLVAFEPDRHLTLRLRRPGAFPPLAGTYAVFAAPNDTSRLVVKLVLRNRSGFPARFLDQLLPPLDLIMMRRQLLNLKALAERSDDGGSSPRRR